MLLIPFDPAVPEEEECELVAVAMSHCAVALQDSNKTVALLGAGVSTSAGVRDFRSSTGLYRSVPTHLDASSSPDLSPPPVAPTPRPPPLSAQKTRDLFSASTLLNPTSRAAHFSFMSTLHNQIDALPSAAPATSTHAFLGMLKRLGRLQRVWTQNVDGLEMRGTGLEAVKLPGVKSVGQAKREGEGDVVQLHGSVQSVRCTVCPWAGKWKARHSRKFAKGVARSCPGCEAVAAKRAAQGKRLIPIRSYLRPSLVLYEEQSPATDTIATLSDLDLSSGPTMLLVMGTTLKIPGFRSLVKSFASAAREQGGICVFVNREEVGKEWDDVFDYHVLSDCDAFVERVTRDWRSSVPETFAELVNEPLVSIALGQPNLFAPNVDSAVTAPLSLASPRPPPSTKSASNTPLPSSLPLPSSPSSRLLTPALSFTSTPPPPTVAATKRPKKRRKLEVFAGVEIPFKKTWDYHGGEGLVK